MPRGLQKPWRSPALWLVLIVCLSTGLRFLGAWFKVGPALFPDEYIYAELARGLRHGATVRATQLNLVSLLEPLLTTPIWSWLDPHAAYRVIQALNALLFSLAAVPAYLLARRLGVASTVALLVSTVSVLAPELVYAGFVSTEAVAYPLFVATVYAALRALTVPRWRTHTLFVVLAGLLVFARVQFIVLPIVYLGAVAALALLTRDRRWLRRQWPAVSCFTFIGLSAAVVKGSAALGSYAGTTSWRPNLGALATWLLKDVYTLWWGSGFVLLAGCLVGVAYALWHPQRLEQRAFALLFSGLFAALLVEGAYFSVNSSNAAILEIVHARYFFYLTPLIALGFALYVTQGFPWRSSLVALSVPAVFLTSHWPLSQLAGDGSGDAPVLQAVHQLDALLGGLYYSRPYLFVLSWLLALLVVYLIWSRKPRAGETVFGIACVLLALASIGTTVHVAKVSTGGDKVVFQTTDHRWLDRLPADTVVVVPDGAARAAVETMGFWKPSLRFALLQGDAPVDAFSYVHVTTDRRGTLLLDGRPLRDVAFLQAGSALTLQSGQTSPASLPDIGVFKDPRLALLVEGYYHQDHWLAAKGKITVWGQTGVVSGQLVLELKSRPGLPGTLLLSAEKLHGKVPLGPQAGQRLIIPVCAKSPWTLAFHTTGPGLFKGAELKGEQTVSVQTPLPRFIPTPSGQCSPK
jgi:hypothetical protein